MKRYLLLAWFAGFCGLLSFSGLATAGTDIQVQITPHSVPNETSSSIVTVKVTNLSHGPIYIPKALSPFYIPEGHLTTNLFTVTNASGAEVKFTGRYMRIIPEDPDWYFLTIEAGQSITQDIDLASDYDLSAGGTFQVAYDQDYATAVHTDPRGQIDSPYASQASEPATIWISSAAAVSLKLQSLSSLPSPGQQCLSSQRDILNQATVTAYPVAYDALKALESLFYYERGTDAHGGPAYTALIKDDNAYSYWFGPARNMRQSVSYVPSYTDYWRTDDDMYMMKVANSVYLRIGAGSYLCGCAEAYDSRTAAWTNPNTQTITFCNRFFQLKPTDGPYDSQALTIIHEISHYNDWWGDGTADYAYGMQRTHEMAQAARHKAVRNADNIMYYMGTFVK